MSGDDGDNVGLGNGPVPRNPCLRVVSCEVIDILSGQIIRQTLDDAYEITLRVIGIICELVGPLLHTCQIEVN